MKEGSADPLIMSLVVCSYFYAVTHFTDGAGGIMFSGCPSVHVCMHECMLGQRHYLTGLPSTASFICCWCYTLAEMLSH